MTNSFVTQLEDGTNRTTTTNGANAFLSTKDAVMDYFAIAGSLRNFDPAEGARLFSRAFSDDPLTAVRLAFYFRDVRQGQGERDHMRKVMVHMATHQPSVLRQLIKFVPEYGRWDDLFVLIGTSVEDDVVAMIQEQLSTDARSEKPSLLAKWMPSENASSKDSMKLARFFAKRLGISSKEYRKNLVALRKKLNIVETKMCARKWDQIEYKSVTSRANMIYNGAFIRHDEDRRRAFLESVASGATKVNAATLYPHEIIARTQYLGLAYDWRENASTVDAQHLDTMWNALPDFVGEFGARTLVCSDVSGSMTGTPMDVAIALGMYFAERTSGPFKEMFMTFSARPQLVKLKGSNVVERAANMSQADWGINTDIGKMLQCILDAATGADASDVPERLIIVSDMQFDSHHVSKPGMGVVQQFKKNFEDAGLTLPQIVFWNVNYRGNVQMTTDDNGWLAVSGFSPSILKFILAQPVGADATLNFNAQLISDVVNSERYTGITFDI